MLSLEYAIQYGIPSLFGLFAKDTYNMATGKDAVLPVNKKFEIATAVAVAKQNKWKYLAYFAAIFVGFFVVTSILSKFKK